MVSPISPACPRTSLPPLSLWSLRSIFHRVFFSLSLKNQGFPRTFFLVFFRLCDLTWRGGGGGFKVIKSVGVVRVALLKPRLTYTTEIYVLQLLHLECTGTSGSMDPQPDIVLSFGYAHSTVVPISGEF